MSANRKNQHVRRSDARRKLVTAWLVAGLMAALSGFPATAGTSTNAEITDTAGDANFISVASTNQQDTRPASIDNVDLRAVWFETAYTTMKIIDSSGAVQRVEYRPKALLVHIQTQAPVRPSSPWGARRYKVQADVPTCRASFELLIGSADAANDKAELRAASANSFCGDDVSFVVSPVAPTYDGALSTMTFPLTDPKISQVLSPGTTLSQSNAHITATLGAGPFLPPVDQTGTGRDFTIGQDVPANIDCTATPSNPACQR
jgi:hypothetical protein